WKQNGVWSSEAVCLCTLIGPWTQGTPVKPSITLSTGKSQDPLPLSFCASLSLSLSLFCSLRAPAPEPQSPCILSLSNQFIISPQRRTASQCSFTALSHIFFLSLCLILSLHLSLTHTHTHTHSHTHTLTSAGVGELGAPQEA